MLVFPSYCLWTWMFLLYRLCFARQGGLPWGLQPGTAFPFCLIMLTFRNYTKSVATVAGIAMYLIPDTNSCFYPYILPGSFHPYVIIIAAYLMFSSCISLTLIIDLSRLTSLRTSTRDSSPIREACQWGMRVILLPGTIGEGGARWARLMGIRGQRRRTLAPTRGSRIDWSIDFIGWLVDIDRFDRFHWLVWFYLVGWFCFIGRLAGWLIGWVVGRSNGWSVD